MTRRTDRLNGLFRQEVSQILFQEMSDPRLRGVVSITQVETSMDLRYARVFLSVLGDQETKEKVLEGAGSAARILRRELRDRLSLKFIPEFTFVLDESIEKGEHVSRLIDRASAEDSSHVEAGGQTS